MFFNYNVKYLLVNDQLITAVENLAANWTFPAELLFVQLQKVLQIKTLEMSTLSEPSRRFYPQSG
jgi:hypothetical protein